MAKDKSAAVASLNPDEFLRGGLPSDFRGTVIAAAFCRWDYDGTIDTPQLFAKLTIQSEDKDEPIEQHWSAGSLDSFVPSQDGKTPCDDNEEGGYAIKVGKRAGLNDNTNFAHLMGSIIDSGTAAKGKPFTAKNVTASIECLIGLDAQWDRVEQKKRGGMVDNEVAEGESKPRKKDVLVVSEVFGYDPDAAASAGKKSKVAKKPAKAKDEDADDDDEAAADSDGDTELDDKIEEAIVAAIAEADGTLKKGKLTAVILKAFAKSPKEKAAAVKRCTEDDFLSEGRAWEYDEDKGTLTI